MQNNNETDNKLKDSIVVSSRIRLARNLENYPFPNRLSESQATEVIDKVKNAINNYDNSFNGILMKQSDMLYKEYLLENHLISKELTSDIKGAVFVNKEQTLSIMVNEEDHLRMQSILPGLSMQEAYNLCNELDDIMETGLKFSFREDLGYITACPTNLGTGMRASVMVHLPALVEMGYINSILENAAQIGLAVRGLYGEGTQFIGSLFQVSNQLTLGLKEEEILANIIGITKQIMEKELEAEKILIAKLGIVLHDRIARLLGILANSRLMKIDESMKFLSEIKLGIRLGWLKGITDEQINNLMIRVQPANQIIDYKATSQELIDISRANLLRNIFKEVEFEV